jgi:iron complex transport system ATP-binding protein
MSVETALRFEHLTLRYDRSAAPVVDAVSFVSKPGEITAIVGPNGSGKSSLVRAVLGLMPSVEGHVWFGETDLLRLPRREVSRRIAVMPQREALAFPMRVRDYVALGRAPYLGVWDVLTAADNSSIDSAMARADVAVFEHRRTDELSGGEWQRVRLARALAQDAPVIVLDEPSTFLDIAHEMATFETLSQEARAGRTVLLVSHTLTLVARFADQIVLMSSGRIAANGTPRDVMQGAILEAVYGWPIVVSHDPAVGAPTLIPLRRPG